MRHKSSLNYFTTSSSFILEDKSGLQMQVCNGGSFAVRIPSHLLQKKSQNRWAHSELKPHLHGERLHSKVTSKSGEEEQSEKVSEKQYTIHDIHKKPRNKRTGHSLFMISVQRSNSYVSFNKQ